LFINRSADVSHGSDGNLVRCFGCGGLFPDVSGPTHRYMEATPGCWAAYGEVLARQYVDAGYATAGQMTVDAYAVQHPGTASQIFGPEGDLNRYVNVYLNDEDVRVLDGLDTPVGERDSLVILPAMAGGA